MKSKNGVELKDGQKAYWNGFDGIIYQITSKSFDGYIFRYDEDGDIAELCTEWATEIIILTGDEAHDDELIDRDIIESNFFPKVLDDNNMVPLSEDLMNNIKELIEEI